MQAAIAPAAIKGARNRRQKRGLGPSLAFAIATMFLAPKMASRDQQSDPLVIFIEFVRCVLTVPVEVAVEPTSNQVRVQQLQCQSC